MEILYSPATTEQILFLIFEVCVLYSADVVKVLEDGDLQTLGLLDYDKRLAHSFTAHPKVDPFTGENAAHATMLYQTHDNRIDH